MPAFPTSQVQTAARIGSSIKNFKSQRARPTRKTATSSLGSTLSNAKKHPLQTAAGYLFGGGLPGAMNAADAAPGRAAKMNAMKQKFSLFNRNNLSDAKDPTSGTMGRKSGMNVGDASRGPMGGGGGKIVEVKPRGPAAVHKAVGAARKFGKNFSSRVSRGKTYAGQVASRVKANYGPALQKAGSSAAAAALTPALKASQYVKARRDKAAAADKAKTASAFKEMQRTGKPTSIGIKGTRMSFPSDAVSGAIKQYTKFQANRRFNAAAKKNYTERGNAAAQRHQTPKFQGARRAVASAISAAKKSKNPRSKYKAGPGVAQVMSNDQIMRSEYL